jgi:hypothetical protein
MLVRKRLLSFSLIFSTLNFEVEDVIDGVERFRMKSNDEEANSNKCAEELKIFIDALDARVSWAINSELVEAGWSQ